MVTIKRNDLEDSYSFSCMTTVDNKGITKYLCLTQIQRDESFTQKIKEYSATIRQTQLGVDDDADLTKFAYLKKPAGDKVIVKYGFVTWSTDKAKSTPFSIYHKETIASINDGLRQS